MRLKYQLSLLTCIFLFACSSTTDKSPNASGDQDEAPREIKLDKIKLPEGFKIEVYASDVKNARSMSLSPNGTLFVGTRGHGSVYALQDTNGDLKIDKQYTLIEDLNMPNGVAFRDGDLYFAEVDKVWVFRDIESKLDNPGEPELIVDTYPDKKHHGWKYIAFGPDGWLYIPVGAHCNICEPDGEIFASITRLNVETKEVEIMQKGVRNTVGFAWHPETKEFWFTDNGGDWLGDDMPACELNYAPQKGMDFGYPYCHQGDFLDPKVGKGKDCADYAAPAQKLGPHVAPLGMEFYQGDMFPAEYRHHAFIAEHGSWNRSTPIGYRLTIVRIENNTKAVSYETFAEGWLDDKTAWGRPVDLEHMPDGSLLVSDDYANAIYRISYGVEE
ncbi:MAG: sorbosone dehydrogenase family protein [Bacteroidetes bacterium]|nr:MAG: sorbosone dehydrogenase family protein [Bacteroidota bacterium]